MAEFYFGDGRAKDGETRRRRFKVLRNPCTATVDVENKRDIYFTRADLPSVPSSSDRRDQVQTSDAQELEAEYNFDAFNKVPPHNEVSSASKSMDLHELRLAKCVQALGQLEVGLREVRECADQMPEFGRLQQMIQKQEQVIAQALQEVSAPDVPENPLVLAADHRTLEELTDALEESKTLESQLSHDLATSQQQLTEAVARISQLESESAAALRQTVVVGKEVEFEVQVKSDGKLRAHQRQRSSAGGEPGEPESRRSLLHRRHGITERARSRIPWWEREAELHPTSHQAGKPPATPAAPKAKKKIIKIKKGGAPLAPVPAAPATAAAPAGKPPATPAAPKAKKKIIKKSLLDFVVEKK